MSDIKSVTQQLVEQLHQDLPMVDDKTITDVVKIITGAPASRSMDQISVALLLMSAMESFLKHCFTVNG